MGLKQEPGLVSPGTETRQDSAVHWEMLSSGLLASLSKETKIQVREVLRGGLWVVTHTLCVLAPFSWTKFLSLNTHHLAPLF